MSEFIDMVCPACGGSGKVKKADCPYCYGDGWVSLAKYESYIVARDYALEVEKLIMDESEVDDECSENG
jgi:DnaJ-class molecular chaperone